MQGIVHLDCPAQVKHLLSPYTKSVILYIYTQFLWSMDFSYWDLQLLIAILPLSNMCGGVRIQMWSMAVIQFFRCALLSLMRNSCFWRHNGFYNVVKYTTSSRDCRWAIKTLMWNRCLVFSAFYERNHAGMGNKKGVHFFPLNVYRIKILSTV